MKKNKRKFVVDSSIELETKQIASGRHSCTREGGRVQSFSCMFLAGNKNINKPLFGFSRANAGNYQAAKSKAMRKSVNTCSSLFIPFSKKTGTISHPLCGRRGSTKVFLFPAGGLVVPNDFRAFFELIGIHNIGMKIIGQSSNKSNVISAILAAFSRSELYHDSIS